MSDASINKEFEDLTEIFQRETGIWPPGRSMPAAYCGGEDKDAIRFRAWEQWRKDRRIITGLKDRIKKLESEIEKWEMSQ